VGATFVAQCFSDSLKASSNSGMGEDDTGTDDGSGGNGKGSKKFKELRAVLQGVLQPASEEMKANNAEASFTSRSSRIYDSSFSKDCCAMLLKGSCYSHSMKDNE
jgi:hypothetical protein